jgi:hypothetical protein
MASRFKQSYPAGAYPYIPRSLTRLLSPLVRYSGSLKSELSMGLLENVVSNEDDRSSLDFERNKNVDRAINILTKLASTKQLLCLHEKSSESYPLSQTVVWPRRKSNNRISNNYLNLFSLEMESKQHYIDLIKFPKFSRKPD